MGNALVISDIHLKPFIFDRAEKILESGQADFAVQLGDLFDDYGKDFDYLLYKKTLNRAIRFHEKFPKTLWCMGNHDFGYYHKEYGRRQSGHSRFMEDEMHKWLRRFANAGLTQENTHVVDGVIFSHAGLTHDWAANLELSWHSLTDFEEMTLEKFKGYLIERAVNNVSDLDLLWRKNSLLWARPQYTDKKMFTDNLQVVGHTPVKAISLADNVLSTDVFSTYPDGTPYGEQKFAIVNTEEKTWKYAKEE